MVYYRFQLYKNHERSLWAALDKRWGRQFDMPALNRQLTKKNRLTLPGTNKCNGTPMSKYRLQMTKILLTKSNL